MELLVAHYVGDSLRDIIGEVLGVFVDEYAGDEIGDAMVDVISEFLVMWVFVGDIIILERKIMKIKRDDSNWFVMILYYMRDIYP